MKVLFKTIAIAAATSAFLVVSATATLAANHDFTNSDRISLELAHSSNLWNLSDGNFTDAVVLGGTLATPSGTPVAVFEDLATLLESRIFLQNRMNALQFDAINSLPVSGVNTPVPEPSSLITALVCGCGVLFGLQRLSRKRA
jgi:hypothetical protein